MKDVKTERVTSKPTNLTDSHALQSARSAVAAVATANARKGESERLDLALRALDSGRRATKLVNENNKKSRRGEIDVIVSGDVG